MRLTGGSFCRDPTFFDELAPQGHFFLQASPGLSGCAGQGVKTALDHALSDGGRLQCLAQGDVEFFNDSRWCF